MDFSISGSFALLFPLSSVYGSSSESSDSDSSDESGLSACGSGSFSSMCGLGLPPSCNKFALAIGSSGLGRVGVVAAGLWKELDGILGLATLPAVAGFRIRSLYGPGYVWNIFFSWDISGTKYPFLLISSGISFVLYRSGHLTLVQFVHRPDVSR